MEDAVRSADDSERSRGLRLVRCIEIFDVYDVLIGAMLNMCSHIRGREIAIYRQMRDGGRANLWTLNRRMMLFCWNRWVFASLPDPDPHSFSIGAIPALGPARLRC